MRGYREIDKGVGGGRVNNRGLERQAEIVTDGLFLDFIHTLNKHTYSQKHIHSQYASFKNHVGASQITRILSLGYNNS